MRKVRSFFLYIAILCGLLSCTDHRDVSDNTNDGNRVAVDVSVVIPYVSEVLPHGRSMAEKPQLDNLYLAVFDASGYLLQYVKADAQLGTENETEYSYKVSLTPTDFPTTIHFIGNAPETVNFGTEVEVLGSMYTSDGYDAYWQRVQLPNGIIKQNDVLDVDVQNALTGVRLIRNFAWIQLEMASTVNNFTLESYCVVNTRSRGSIAPYNTKINEFVDYTESVKYVDLLTDGYDAFIPEGAEIYKNIPDEQDWYHVASGNTNAYFIYERELPRSSPSFILMKGTYDPDTNESGDEKQARYYKVDLRNNAGEYFPVLRNFRYRVEVNNITHEGHASAQIAAEGAGSGDVSTSIETEDFSNISNNIARIFVSYTDKTLVSRDVVPLKYKFMLFTNDGYEMLNDNVQVILEASEGGNVIESYTIQNADDDEEWRTIEITPAELGSIRKIQSLVLIGSVVVEGKTYTLQRRVRFTLHEKMNMLLECVPNAIVREIGKPFDLELKVPGGLSDAMFPLEFELEAVEQSMTPNLGDDLPVKTGNSIVPGKESKTTIGFVKSLSWDEYDAITNENGYKTVTCHFKSSKAESATMIYASNMYFNLAFTELGNYSPSQFRNLTFNPNSVPFGIGKNIDFSFTMDKLPDQGYVTVTLGGLEPAPTETRLTYLGVVDNKAQYAFNPNSEDNTLKLVTQYEANNVDVKLEAYRFTEASASLDYVPGTFNIREFPQKIDGNAAGVSVRFRFDMSKLADNVVVTLTGLRPADNETRLTLISGNRYSFTPSATSNTLQLVTTTDMSGDNPRVTLEAAGFTTVSAEATWVLYIPANNINVGGSSNINKNSNVTFYLYSEYPGKNNISSFGNFKTKRNGSNSSAIEIAKEHYNAIRENGGNVYIRFQNGGSYYVATIGLVDLLKAGGATLSFSKVN